LKVGGKNQDEKEEGKKSITPPFVRGLLIEPILNLGKSSYWKTSLMKEVKKHVTGARNSSLFASCRRHLRIYS